MTKYLKLFMVALFATLTVTLTSCGDDDEPSAGNIDGTWMENSTHYIQFNSDKSYYEVNIDEDGVDVLKGSWQLDGNSITIHSYDLSIDFTAEIKKVSQKELVVTMWGFTQTYKKVADSEIDKYLK
ncbi:MAG: hypothetical protein K2J42_07725 [Muribaculaceae bacterium]|nr:hypothetical protein [Muribaculaceae bacterium]